ncbi:YjbH domain-containing protein [Solimonas marina]|uniref:YjbH domain-containing protein n=1 Tax=Solimonas marina TaxID=2714601 RepID=A0A970B7E1_9GAMM|nr:YjbH domain-containing protein [Solimonas marina]NKF21114.1 YjbH domain-containing protein [Solimonas marina]
MSWVLGLALPFQAGAADYSTYNDYADVGLLQTPTARVADAGEFGVGLGVVDPYRQFQLSLQLFNRLETSFHYSEVTDVLYGPESFSGHQSYKDRSFDVKYLLAHEGSWTPSLAVGVMDLGGTGIYSSEYFVANKQLGDFDFSLGLGWGRLGARGGIKNPFRAISSHFDDRDLISESGSTGAKRLFTGQEIGVFGGVRWQTPIQSLSVIAELDGNDFKHEARGNEQKVDSPVNFGIAWRPNPYIDAHLGYERGNTIAARITLRTNFNRDLGPPKFLDKPMPRAVEAQPVSAPHDEVDRQASDASASPSSDITTSGGMPLPRDGAVWDAARAGCHEQGNDLEATLRKALASQGVALQGLGCANDGTTLIVWFTQGRYRSEADGLGRIARVLAQQAPAHFTAFRLSEIFLGFETYRVTVPRLAAEQLLTDQASPQDVQDQIQVDAPHLDWNWEDCCNTGRYPAYSWFSAPALRQHVGGPDGFYFYQIWWKLGGTIALNPHWNVSGQVGANIYNNFDGLKQPSNSVLPHVRSDIVKYLDQGKNNLVRLETNYFFPVADSLYGRVSAGLFEEMYGGVTGELLYRPFQSPWAVSARVAHLWQRDYDQRFDFLDYEVTTGFITGYYEYRPARMLFQLSYGRYLAKDWGATLNIGKTFRSGVTVGAFATKTNVSSADFGEGSFDKGIYIAIPLDFFVAKSTRRYLPLVFRPLTRDGGQMARDGQSLYGATTTLPEFSANDPYILH